ncbi:MAG: alpha/beta hydrolase [Solirubrobacteraceae bacterium]
MNLTDPQRRAAGAPYAVDPEVAAGVAELAGEPQVVARGDWRELRRVAGEGMRRLAELEARPRPAIEVRAFAVRAPDGASIDVRWYARRGAPPGSAVVFAHGGGLIAGDLDLYDGMVSRYADETGAGFLSVDYRLAPAATATTPADDAFAALHWLRAHAGDLGVEPRRVAVMGESAGGGIAAGVAIRARDAGIALAGQLLIYPMLDDRTVVSDGARDGLLTWDHDASFTCWSALLGAERGTDGVSPLAAPARLTDFRGLAPAYVEVGDLDIFRDEDISYAQRLAAADVPVELHVHPGAPHGYDRYASHSALARRAMADRLRVLRAL